MTIDYHSHCLPAIDDGAKSVEEGIKMLETLKKQGVGLVCLTPHFNVSMSVESFLEHRAHAYERIIEKAGAAELPKLVLGAEVHISPELSDVKNIDKLVYEGTDRMLLELPYDKYSPRYGEEIDSLIAKYDIKPVMAHIERYSSWYDWPYGFLEKFEYADAVYQFNVTPLSQMFTRRKIKTLISEGLPVVFGSDAHNVDSRPPRFDLFMKYGLESSVKNIFEELN